MPDRVLGDPHNAKPYYQFSGCPACEPYPNLGLNGNGAIIGQGKYPAFTCRIRPFYDNLSIEWEWLFYAVPDTNTCGPETVFCDRFWDEREGWYNAGVGIVTGTTRPYFGRIPERPQGPLVGTPDMWMVGLSYKVWLEGGYASPVPCWPVSVPNGKVKVSQRQSIYQIFPPLYHMWQNQSVVLSRPVPKIRLSQLQSIKMSYMAIVWILIVSGDTPTEIDWMLQLDNTTPFYPPFLNGAFTGPFALVGTDRLGLGFDVYEARMPLFGYVAGSGPVYLSITCQPTTEGNESNWDISNGPAKGYDPEIGYTDNFCDDGNSESCSLQILDPFGRVIADNTNPAFPGSYYGSDTCAGAWNCGPGIVVSTIANIPFYLGQQQSIVLSH